MDNSNYVKVLFRFYSDILDEETVETMWATIVDKEKGYYKLDSIPFYVGLIACENVILAEYDTDEKMLTYREIVEFSGNSTIHAIVMNDSHDINAIRKIFQDMNCVSERVNDKYFAMEIPAKVEYKSVKERLDELQKEEVIDYAESCLSEIHQY